MIVGDKCRPIANPLILPWIITRTPVATFTANRARTILAGPPLNCTVVAFVKATFATILDANVGRFLFVAFVAPSFSIPEIFFAVFFVAVFCASVFFAVARFWLFTVHLPITRACWNEWRK